MEIELRRLATALMSESHILANMGRVTESVILAALSRSVVRVLAPDPNENREQAPLTINKFADVPDQEGLR